MTMVSPAPGTNATDTQAATAPPAAGAGVSTETLIALRNGVMLTASLVGTLGVAVAVRIWMPRFLGPDAFGKLQFAEEFSAAAMFFTSLGVETYIKREVATRPEHASEFFGGLLYMRAMATVVVGFAIAILLHVMNKPVSDWPLVFIFALGQAAFVLNTSQASCLQAVGKVREIALVNVFSKLLWGASIVLGLALGFGLIVVPAAYLATELLKVPVLHWATQKHLALKLDFSLRPMLAVLVFSLPYYLNQVSHEVYARLGTTLISSLTAHAEVGFYGAANQVKTLVLLALPIVNAVVLPMSSRVARESEQSLNELMQTAVRMSFMLVVPLAIVLTLNADLVVHVLFTRDYMPAVRSLQVLALLIPLSIYAVLAGMHLIQLNRIWAMTNISLAGLAFSAVANPYAIKLGYVRFAPGGAGMGAATVALLTELLVALLMWRTLGKAASDGGRTSRTLARLVAVCVAVAGLHYALPFLGYWRLPADVAAYLAMAALAGVLPVREIAVYGRALLHRKT